jgi:hypothetical protein
MRLFFGLLFSLAVSAAGLPSSLAHDHWINQGRYASPKNGMPCCGEDDCFSIPEAARADVAGREHALVRLHRP